MSGLPAPQISDRALSGSMPSESPLRLHFSDVHVFAKVNACNGCARNGWRCMRFGDYNNLGGKSLFDNIIPNNITN